MNKHIFLLALIATVAALNTKAQTSIYHPFPDSNAVWNGESLLTGMPPTFLQEDYSYTLSGDTVIGAYPYHKIYIPFVLKTGDTIQPSTHVAGYQGCIRQDTTAKKEFFIQPGNSTEHLLYDFSLQVGDAVPNFFTQYSGICCDAIVVSIDSVLVGSNYNKKWYCGDTSFYASWSYIEGVGSKEGLLDVMCEGGIVCLDPVYFVSLACFSQNQVTLYHPLSSNSCNLVMEVADDFVGQEATIFPNPFHNNATLHTGLKFRNSILRIYNIFGDLVREEVVNNQSLAICRNELQGGIYFYKLINSKGQMENGKFAVE